MSYRVSLNGTMFEIAKCYKCGREENEVYFASYKEKFVCQDCSSYCHICYKSKLRTGLKFCRACGYSSCKSHFKKGSRYCAKCEEQCIICLERLEDDDCFWRYYNDEAKICITCGESCEKCGGGMKKGETQICHHCNSRYCKNCSTIEGDCLCREPF